MIVAFLVLAAQTAGDAQHPYSGDYGQKAYSDCLVVNFDQLMAYPTPPTSEEAVARAIVRCGPVRSSARSQLIVSGFGTADERHAAASTALDDIETTFKKQVQNNAPNR